MSTAKYLKPATVEDAIEMAMEHIDDFSYLSGGTDVLVNKYQGNDRSACLIDLGGIDELRQVCSNGKQLAIGASVKLDHLKNFSEITDRFPALIEAANAVATPVLRKTATLGGNLLCENRCIFYNQSEWWREAVGYCLKCEGDICIASGGKNHCYSKFVSDTAPVLISLNASVEIRDRDGSSFWKVEDLYTGDGINPRKLDKTAILKNVFLPEEERYHCVFKKLRPRKSVDFTSLTTAVSMSESGRIRIVLGGVDPKPVLIEGSVDDREEDLILQAVKKPRILDNDVYNRQYRKQMIQVFLKRSIAELKTII